MKVRNQLGIFGPRVTRKSAGSVVSFGKMCEVRVLKPSALAKAWKISIASETMFVSAQKLSRGMNNALGGIFKGMHTWPAVCRASIVSLTARLQAGEVGMNPS